MIRKILLVLMAASLLVGCGFTWKDEGVPPRKGGQHPEILSFHADRVIRPGETWKVYLKLRDVDCDMTYVVTDLWQIGAGSYPVSFTPIRDVGCPEVVGYVFLTTPPDRALLWSQYEAKILVRDRQGNHSNSIHLPLNFDWVSAKRVPPQWQGATVISIGAIPVDIVYTLRSDTGRE